MRTRLMACSLTLALFSNACGDGESPPTDAGQIDAFVCEEFGGPCMTGSDCCGDLWCFGTLGDDGLVGVCEPGPPIE